MSEVVDRSFTQEFRRHYNLYVPQGDGPFPLVIGMHGYGGDRVSLMRLLRRINETDFAIVALQGPHQHVIRGDDPAQPLKYGFGWATNFEFDESMALHASAIRTIVSQMQGHPRVDAERVFLFGFSQAVAVNFRFAFTSPDVVRGVVGVCGGIPGDWSTDDKYVRGNFDVLYLAGRTDEYYSTDKMKANAEALLVRARSVEFRIFECGHEIPREAYDVISEWLLAR